MMVQADFERTFAGWRDEARRLLLLQVPPNQVNWHHEASLLLIDEPVATIENSPSKRTVPADFINLAENVACANEPERWALLYRILYRLLHGEPNLLKISVDPDIHRAELLRKSVRRDIHKMHAFVRFKKLRLDDQDTYVAWHKPEHLILKPGTPFFARRFGDRRWSIFTPNESAHWDLQALTFGPGMPQSDFQVRDDWDGVWKTYYRSIFNPARIKIKMMKQEMSPKYWSSMPETELIRDLVREAPGRLQTMAANQNHAAQIDASLSLDQLQDQAKGCKSCPLHARATQTVFGVGPGDARIMIVGEQPGDQEDRLGRPFAGPAGKIFDQALATAQLERKRLYITNAVKHFKWIERGKTRLHQKPTGSEMHACKPWLEAEIARVQPMVIVALGATAATAVLGRLPKISAERGQVLRGLKVAPAVIISWHPSAILRAPAADGEKRLVELGADLTLARIASSPQITPELPVR